MTQSSPAPFPHSTLASGPPLGKIKTSIRTCSLPRLLPQVILTYSGIEEVSSVYYRCVSLYGRKCTQVRGEDNQIINKLLAPEAEPESAAAGNCGTNYKKNNYKISIGYKRKCCINGVNLHFPKQPS